MNRSRSRWFGRYSQHREGPRTRQEWLEVPPRLIRTINRLAFRTWTITLAYEPGSGLALQLFFGDPEAPSRLAMSRPVPVAGDASPAELVELVRAAVEEVAGPGAGAELVYRPERPRR